MRICIATPAPPRSRAGNRVTALRWARVLRELGHTVAVVQEWNGQQADLLIALHAVRSAGSIARFHRERPESSLVVALTGTDLYDGIEHSTEALQSIASADRLVVLQAEAHRELPKSCRRKVRVIVQSVPLITSLKPAERTFDVCVLGHLRDVKDPFRAGLAARILPGASRIRVLQVGAALSDEMERQALAESAQNQRYQWLGELPRGRALRVLARSRLLVVSSRMEGGANVVSEAIAASVPILATRISGSIGILGRRYPGYFEVGDTNALAVLMRQCETDRKFYAKLRKWVRGLRPLINPTRERQSWRQLIDELERERKLPRLGG